MIDLINVALERPVDTWAGVGIVIFIGAITLIFHFLVILLIVKVWGKNDKKYFESIGSGHNIEFVCDDEGKADDHSRRNKTFTGN